MQQVALILAGRHRFQLRAMGVLQPLVNHGLLLLTQLAGRPSPETQMPLFLLELPLQNSTRFTNVRRQAMTPILSAGDVGLVATVDICAISSGLSIG